jgi:hypothetical protein
LPFHASGTLGGKFNRKQTAKSEWDEAKVLVASRETADAWEGKSPLLSEPAPVSTPARVTIADAIKLFSAIGKGRRSSTRHCGNTRHSNGHHVSQVERVEENAADVAISVFRK